MLIRLACLKSPFDAVKEMLPIKYVRLCKLNTLLSIFLFKKITFFSQP